MTEFGGSEMIKSIEMSNFRLFKNKNIILGKHLTVIAGKNAVGKSNLLGILGNSVELKKNKPIIHKNYRTEFSDIFKGSLIYDPSSSNKYRVNFCDPTFSEICDYRDFRVSWQDNKTRFRLIPNKKLPGGKKTEAKVEWPTLYLGLSRLFPIGESEDKDIEESKLKLSESEEDWFIEKYKKILSLSQESFESISQINIKSNKYKKGIGITTPTYDYLTNSAGQDNIGQILCSIISFKRLKNELGDTYTGGLLLIDELDATLHPLAQNLLVDLLYKESKANNIQTVFTTHSMSLLEYITNKTYCNTRIEDVNNNIEIAYLTNDNYVLEIDRNPTFNYIKNELLLESAVHQKNKVKIYVEDDEAKWLLENLLNDYKSNIDIKSTKLGSDELLKLNKIDAEYFSTIIIALDGDVTQNDILSSSSGSNTTKNVLLLPGAKRPESIFYDYLISLNPEHEFLVETRHLNYSLRYFRDKGPDSYPGDQAERERYKNWFNGHLEHFKAFQLYDHWEIDNQDIVDQFIREFKLLFNDIAKNLRLPRI